MEIPKEEPKQDWFCPKCDSYVSSESVTFEETHQICNTGVVIKKPKQGTLEEAAERYTTECGDGYDDKAFIAGAKWQQERMYSEGDIIKILIEYDYSKINDDKLNSVGMIKEWFEQFKSYKKHKERKTQKHE